MKVNDSTGTGISGISKPQELTSSSPASRARNGSSERGDQISLSSLGSALSASETDSPSRNAQLSQLTAAVSSGRYAVNAQALSGRIIDASIRA